MTKLTKEQQEEAERWFNFYMKNFNETKRRREEFEKTLPKTDDFWEKCLRVVAWFNALFWMVAYQDFYDNFYIDRSHWMKDVSELFAHTDEAFLKILKRTNFTPKGL